MIDKDAIQEIAKAQAITAANAAIDREQHGQVALPNDFTLIDMEKYMKHRRRLRGNMATSVVGDFASYTEKNAEEGATIFIDPEKMTACSVLNMGTPEKPGHSDNTATLTPTRTAAYAAMRAFGTGDPLSQKQVAEFLEDWADNIKCHDADGLIAANKAISAIRKITIESLKKIEAEEKTLSASRSAFESVEAKSTEKIPVYVEFTCKPYSDFEERTFSMRLGVLTGGQTPMVNLRIVKINEHEEQMANELSNLISDSLSVGSIPALIGKYGVR